MDISGRTITNLGLGTKIVHYIDIYCHPNISKHNINIAKNIWTAINHGLLCFKYYTIMIIYWVNPTDCQGLQ